MECEVNTKTTSCSCVWLCPSTLAFEKVGSGYQYNAVRYHLITMYLNFLVSLTIIWQMYHCFYMRMIIIG